MDINNGEALALDAMSWIGMVWHGWHRLTFTTIKSKDEMTTKTTITARNISTCDCWRGWVDGDDNN